MEKIKLEMDIGNVYRCECMCINRKMNYNPQ